MVEIDQSATLRLAETGPTARNPVPAARTSRWKWSSLILFVAMVANAAIVLVVLPLAQSRLALTYSIDFGDLYDLIGKSLEQGYGYRVEPTTGYTMLREPGYPFLLAAVFKFAGYGIQQARFLCVLLAAGAALLLARLARRVTGDATTALVAALLFLLHPGILVAEARAGIEVPSILTVLLFMLVLYSAVEKGGVWRYWTAGLLLGLAVLVRSEVLLFPLMLLGYLLLTAEGFAGKKRAVEGIGLLAIGAAIAVSPWIIRNYSLVQQFVPTATVTGTALQEGLYTCKSPATTEQFVLEQRKAGVERAELATRLGLPFTGPYYQLFYTPYDEVAFNHALVEGVFTEYRKDPALLAGCAAKNLLFNFWFLGKTRQSTLLNLVMQAPLLALGLAGIVTLWRTRLLRRAGIVLAYILYIPSLHAVIIAHARHSMLIVPFLVILAACFVTWAGRALARKTTTSPAHPVNAATAAE